MGPYGSKKLKILLLQISAKSFKLGKKKIEIYVCGQWEHKKNASISEMVIRGVKRSEICDSVTVETCILGTFDFLMFKTILGSFCTLVSNSL